MKPNKSFIFFIPANPTVQQERLISQRLQSFKLILGKQNETFE